MPERTPAELAHAWRDALLHRDADAFAGLFAEDARFVDVEHRTPDLGAARPVAGREAIREVARRWLGEAGAFEYDVVEVLSDGASAAVRWRYRVPGVSGGIELDGVSWLRCVAGEIAEAHVWFDSLALFRSLGRA